MGEKKVREKKKPTFFLAVLPILAMILLLGVGYAVMGLSPEVLMLVSAAVAAVIAVALGYTWDDIMNSIVGKLSKTMPAIFILIIVGFLIGSWMIGGTIPMMVYYGCKFISPRYIAVTCPGNGSGIPVYRYLLGFRRNHRCGADGCCGRHGRASSSGGGRRRILFPVRTLVTKCLRFPIPQTSLPLRRAQSCTTISDICFTQRFPAVLSASSSIR